MTRALIIDDDPAVHLVLERILTQAGWEVAHAYTGAQAAAAGTEFDAVLLDLTLDRESGWEVLEQLRTLGASPVILMTGSAVEPADQADALRAGAAELLAKPIAPHELMAALAVTKAGPRL